MGKKKEIIRLCGKLMILFLPIFLFYSLSFLILFLSGELVSINHLVNENLDKKEGFLMGLGYSNPVKNYKMQSTIKRSPKVLALGTSRVMQFRSGMFKDNVFYNAGGGVSRMEHFMQFLNRIPNGKEPEVLIIGLDHYFFNDNWRNSPQSKMEGVEGYESSVNWFDPSIHTKVYADWINDKFSLAMLYQGLIEKENIKGINAIIKNNGFRSDGSYYYGKVDPEDTLKEDYKFRNTYDRIIKGNRRFEYGSQVSKSSLTELAGFLSECKRRKIHVVGFLPPYAHEIWLKMYQDSTRYGYLKNIYSNISVTFNKFNFSCFDFSDIKSLGATDQEILDGFHGSEKAYFRIIIHLSLQDKILKNYTLNIETLNGYLNSSNDIYVFNIER